jgi:dihydrofolate reductase
MSRVIYMTSTTLNGFLADEHNSLQWLFAVPDAEDATAANARFMDSVGVLVEGSTTYRWVLEHEDLLAHPERWREFYGDSPTFVFTHQELPLVAGADIRLVRGSVAEAFPDIVAAAADRDIWVVGGGDLAGQFLDAGLLDELIIQFGPATLTAGAPLLPRVLGADRLHLDTVIQRGQFAELHYTVTR